MFAADWALKRLCKFLLKRNLKHLLRTEIDLDQLELGKGSLELKEVLLNECYLSEQLVGSPSTALEALPCRARGPALQLRHTPAGTQGPALTPPSSPLRAPLLPLATSRAGPAGRWPRDWWAPCVWWCPWPPSTARAFG